MRELAYLDAIHSIVYIRLYFLNIWFVSQLRMHYLLTNSELKIDMWNVLKSGPMRRNRAFELCA